MPSLGSQAFPFAHNCACARFPPPYNQNAHNYVEGLKIRCDACARLVARVFILRPFPCVGETMHPGGPEGTFRFSIDRGGTFTDVYAECPGGKVRVMKLLSEDPLNYRDAPTEAIRRILEEVNSQKVVRVWIVLPKSYYARWQC